MSWKDDYNKKVCTPEEAIKDIHDGQWIALGHAAGVPKLVPHALAEHRNEYNGVHVFHMTTLGDNELLHPESYGHFHHVSNFLSGNSRQAIVDLAGDFFPGYFHDVPQMLGNEIPCDVAVFMATRPNADGYCSLSVSCDYALEAIRKAKVVIMELNDQMPFIGNEGALVHVSQMTHIIPCSYALPELGMTEPNEVEAAIGRYCASLVDDGATLQLGIGAIPNAVLKELGDKNDLGIHSEMFSDGVMGLMQRGNINGKKKTLHPEKVVATFIMGSKELYDFCDNNPAIEVYPVDYVNDPVVIAKNYRMISINSCIEVDFMGQVASEMIGPKQYSGIGGQIDFIRGAAMAKDGKSIIAMPSTAAHGKVSRIKPFLTPGAAVSTPRNDVHYVITEYGIACLRGRTLRQRAHDLIGIAHPQFRPELIEEFEKRYQCKYEA